jgi:hypothetical protein
VTEASSVAPAAARTSGTVTGVPRRWLRLEAAVLLAGSLIAFSATGQPWWLVPVTILVPDLLAAGYLGGTRLGAQLCNVAHSTALPAAVAGLGLVAGQAPGPGPGPGLARAHRRGPAAGLRPETRRQLPAHPPWPARPAGGRP